MQEKVANGWKPPPLSEDGRERLSEKMKKWCAEWKASGYPNRKSTKGQKMNLSDEQRANRSKKAVQNLERGVAKRTGTTLEIKMEQYLCEDDIGYKCQFSIYTPRGSWAYDFYIPELNLLLETDGEYFHSRPKQINRDIIKEKLAREHGYNFLRISSTDWRPEMIFRSPEEQISHCKTIMDRRLANPYKTKKRK